MSVLVTIIPGYIFLYIMCICMCIYAFNSSNAEEFTIGDLFFMLWVSIFLIPIVLYIYQAVSELSNVVLFRKSDKKDIK